MKNIQNFKSIRPIATVLLAMILLLSSCRRDGVFCIRGTGPVTTESRTLTNFSQIEAALDATIYLYEDSVYSFVAEGQQNILENVTTTISSGKLIIRNKKCVRGNSRLVIRIHAPLIADVNLAGSGNITLYKKSGLKISSSSFKVSGSGDIHVVGDVVADNIYNQVTGSGNLDLSVNSLYTSTEITGSGKITLGGRSTSQDLKITGSGKLYAYNLQTDDTWVDISGSGYGEISANNNLDVDMSGSGTIYYKGWPHLSARISGSGKVTHKD